MRALILVGLFLLFAHHGEGKRRNPGYEMIRCRNVCNKKIKDPLKDENGSLGKLPRSAYFDMLRREFECRYECEMKGKESKGDAMRLIKRIFSEHKAAFKREMEEESEEDW